MPAATVKDARVAGAGRPLTARSSFSSSDVPPPSSSPVATQRPRFRPYSETDPDLGSSVARRHPPKRTAVSFLQTQVPDSHDHTAQEPEESQHRVNSQRKTEKRIWNQPNDRGEACCIHHEQQLVSNCK